MESWIKLHRKIMEWEWYTDPVVPRVFVHLLLRANIKTKKWMGITINPGEIVTSLPKLSCELDLSIKQIRTALDKLESSQCIGRQTTNKYTLIKVLNYCQYQRTELYVKHDIGTQEDMQGACEGQTNGSQRATTKEYKELKNDRQEEIYINNINNSARAHIINLYEQNIGVPSPMTREILADLISSHSADLVELAIEEAVKSNARNLRYIESIIHRWDDLGVKTLNDAKLAIAEHQSNKAKSFNQSKGGTHDSIKPNTEKPKPIYGSLIV